MDLANPLYKVHTEFHQAKSITATLRRANVKNLDKKNMKKFSNQKFKEKKHCLVNELHKVHKKLH